MNDLEIEIESDEFYSDVSDPYVQLIASIKLETEGEYGKSREIAKSLLSSTSDPFLQMAASVMVTFSDVRLKPTKEMQNSFHKLEDTIDELEAHYTCMNETEVYNWHFINAIFQTVKSTYAFYRNDYTTAIDTNKQAIHHWEAIDETDGVNLIMIDLIFCYNHTGKFDNAMQLSNLLIDRVDISDDALTYCHTLISRGEIFKLQGNYGEASTNFQQLHELATDLGHDPLIFHNSRFLAEIYTKQGYYGKAFKLQHEILDYFQKSDNAHFISIILNDMGVTSRSQGELDQASDYFEKSISKSMALGIYDETITSYYNLILTHLQKESSIDTLELYRNKIKSLLPEVENPRYSVLPKIVTALILFTHKRLEEKFKAIPLLRELIEDTSVYYEYQLTCIYYQLDLLLLEYNYTKESIILDEVYVTIEYLNQIGQKMHSYAVLIDYYLLLAKFENERGNFEEVSLLLDDAEKIALRSEVDEMLTYISSEKDFIEDKMRLQTNISEISNPQFGMVTSYVRKLQSGKQPLHQMNEINPLLVMIMSIGGMSLYSREFERTLLSEINLVSSFLSAIISFSEEAFQSDSSIELIKIGRENLILKSIGDLIICFIYQGHTPTAVHKLNEFAIRVVEQRDIINRMNKSNLQSSDKKILDSLTFSIFGD